MPVRRSNYARNNRRVTAKVLFLYNEHLATEALLGEAFVDQGFDVDTFEVASADCELIPGGRWFQWHYDRWTLPPGAIELARTADASQAFLLGRALALQFHPEVDLRLLNEWLADDRNGEIAAFGLTHDELRSQTIGLADEAATRAHRLVDGFVTRVIRQACPSS